jgi:head-tail adaptor
MPYDRPITIQVQDETTEEWADALHLHAKVNKTGGGQTLNAGADQFHAALTFEVTYSRALEALRFDPQHYRVVYRDHTFKVTDYDDFMEQHRTVRLVGVLYG